MQPEKRRTLNPLLPQGATEQSLTGAITATASLAMRNAGEGNWLRTLTAVWLPTHRSAVGERPKGGRMADEWRTNGIWGEEAGRIAA
ncbi:MAG TPA: hypothetical protein DCY79_17585 [Planctomycetaceae bacterium]|nr:hypothetical protein [Planctomycetaceae bacterium]